MSGLRTRRVELDLADIQGNVLTAYGRQGFPKGRQLVFNIRDPDAGRKFLQAVLPRVTSGLRWESSGARKLQTREIKPDRPEVAVNVAFTFRGLLAMGVPIRTLRALPDEFIDGMAAREALLGDDFPPDRIGRWDPVWTHEGDPLLRVHMLVSLNAQMNETTGEPKPALRADTDWLIGLAQASGDGVVLLRGHRGADDHWQEMAAILSKGVTNGQPHYEALPSEHFGFADGIGDPVFEGQYEPEDEADRVRGNGALVGPDPKRRTPGYWRPLATGEFLLGYPDEAQEVAGFAAPASFSRNGVFMAYRKLHENVVAFHAWVDAASAKLGAVWGIADPLEARETLLAKMAGRWSDGVPISKAETYAEWREFGQHASTQGKRRIDLSDFTFADDPEGVKCPLISHLRRANPRDSLDPYAGPASSEPTPQGSRLNNRRRILRRGLPYGPIDSREITSDAEEHGIIMLVYCASLARQFEFVQQQWMNYGLDFNAGNDTCPVIGNHGPEEKFVVPADPTTGHPPFIAEKPPNFVETRGGAYFFVPSLTSLRTIAMGVTDPT